MNADTERDELAALVRDLGVVHGHVTLSSGAEAEYYVDLRRVTLEHRAAPLVGRLLRVLTADWEYSAVGGLTLGADPIACAVSYASASSPTPVRAFTVRKEPKTHGTAKLIEGAFVTGDRVAVIEDTITTGGSAKKAVDAVRAAGGVVVGVLALVDREEGGREALEAEGLEVVSLTRASEIVRLIED
jgi:orotate phosphoribosyltransferase